MYKCESFSPSLPPSLPPSFTLFGARTRVGRLSFETRLAMTNVLPVPVAPLSATRGSPASSCNTQNAGGISEENWGCAMWGKSEVCHMGQHGYARKTCLL